MAKRTSAFSSLGQPSQPKRPCPTLTDQVWHQSENNLVRRSCLTEEEAQRMFREEAERVVSNWAESFQRQFREEAERIFSNWAESFQSLVGNAFEEIMQQISSRKNAVQKPEETVELANSQSPHLGRGNAKSASKNGARNLQLQFRTKLPDTLFTGKKVAGEGGARISIALIDANTEEVVKLGPESSIKLGVVVLEGDFNKDYEDDWTQEEFEGYMVKERERKGRLLTGDSLVTLKGGVGELGELTFLDNSSWIRSGKFRIGVMVASGNCGNTRIREAITDAFRVKEQRGELSKKHDLPKFEDEVWRLKMIAKDGSYHQRLSKAGICTVKDFLLQLSMNPVKLNEILDMKSNSKKWDILQNHAKSCTTNWKLNSYYPDGSACGVVFNADFQLIGLIQDGICFSADRLKECELEYGNKIVKEANHKCSNDSELNAETFCSSKKSLSSFPSQVLEGETENLTPVQCNLVPRVCAPPGGPEAPPENVGFTAEGHNGATALALPVHLQNTNSGNAMKLSVDKSVCLAAQQPICTDPLNALIPPGESVIPTVKLPMQSHGDNIDYAMHSHMTHPLRQKDYMGNESIPPSEPFLIQFSSKLPHSQGNHLMEDFPSIGSDDKLGDWWSDDPSYDFDTILTTPLDDVGSVRGTNKEWLAQDKGGDAVGYLCQEDRHEDTCQKAAVGPDLL